MEYTQKNLFEILLNQPEIRLYLTIFRLILHQIDVRFVPNQSENGKYNLISGWFNNISLCEVEIAEHAPTRPTL